MSSRRLMTRSYSAGDGRASYHTGDDVTGRSRASGCSYLSSVRLENSHSFISHSYSQYRPSRRTLHCVMQQLTEETQPFFESTLRSRAVSENCNTQFSCEVSGHPAPEVTWYKDDTQLDRYCGLPKYKISCNGQNHSLHIYNCTEEDAAIYQASARNSKGIVSCSGVLEVGTMSEYKIHQQYFGKIKLNAEKKRRELEEPKLCDKENPGSTDGQQETLRSMSLDWSQRKGCSPMDSRLSSLSSMEDEVEEDNAQAQAAEVESRLQDTAAGGIELGTSVNGTGASYINGDAAITANGSSEEVTCDYDSWPKSLAPQTPKVSVAKKKIKISNGKETEKTVDRQAGKGPENERGITEGEVTTTPYLAMSSTSSSETMEADSTIKLSASKTGILKDNKQTKKVSQHKTLSIMGEVKTQLEDNTLQKEKCSIETASASTKGQTISGTKNENVSMALATRKVGNNSKGTVEVSQSTVPPVISIQPNQSPSGKLRSQTNPSYVMSQPQQSEDVTQKQQSTSVKPEAKPSFSLKMQTQAQPSLSVKPQLEAQPGLSVKTQSGLSVKPQPNLSVKPKPRPIVKSQPGISVKQQPGLSVKPQPGLSVKPQPGLSVKPQKEAQPSLSVEPQTQQDLSTKQQKQPSPHSAKHSPIPSTHLHTQPSPLFTPQPQSSPPVKPQQEPSFSVTPQPQPSMSDKPQASASVTPQPSPFFMPQPQPCPFVTPQLQPSASVTPQPSPSVTPQPQSNPSVMPKPQPSPSVTSQLQPIPSVTPQLQPSPSVTPQQQPSPTVTPQLKPSPSVKPQLKPSPSVTPQLQPRTSVMPQLQPRTSVMLDLQPRPSVTPQLQPSPSVTPQLHPRPSVMPQLQPRPSVMPQLQPSPSVTPQLQPRRSVTSQLQPIPSVTPQLQPSPSVTPQPQPSPTVTPQPSPLVKPQLQTSPSVTPQPKQSPSVRPQLQPSPSVMPQLQQRPSVMSQLQPIPSVTLQLQPSPSVTPQPQPSLSVKPQLQPSPSVTPQLQPNPSVMSQLQLSPSVTPQPSSSVMSQPQPSPSVTPQPSPTLTPQPSPLVKPQLQPSPSITPKPQPSPSVTPKLQPSPSVTPQTQPSPSVKPQLQTGPCPPVSITTSKPIITHQQIITDDKLFVLENVNRLTLDAKTECPSKDSTTVLGELQAAISSIHGTGTTMNMAGDSVESGRVVPCESSEAVPALPQHPWEQSRDQISEEETSTSPKNVSVSQLPGLWGEEVTQTQRKKIGGNVAPGCPEPLTFTTQSKLDMQSQQRRPSVTDDDFPTDANKRTSYLHNTSQSASDKMMLGKLNYFIRSNESHPVPFTELVVSPLESPAVGDSTLGCSVSLVGQQVQVQIAIKNTEETEIQVDLKANANMVGEVHGDSYDKKPDLETVHKVTRINKVQESEIKIISKTPVKKTVDSETVELLDVESENSKSEWKIAEGKILDIPKIHPQTLSLNPHVHTFNTDKTNAADTTAGVNIKISEQQTQCFKDTPKPLAKVMSIAELLRSQLSYTDVNALPQMSEVPFSPPPVINLNTDQLPKASPSRDTQEMRTQSLELKMSETEHRQEPEKRSCMKETDTSIDSISDSNFKVTSKAFIVPPISILDMDGTLVKTNHLVCIATGVEDVRVTKQEQVLNNPAYISLDGNKDGQREDSPIGPDQKSSEITVASTPILSVTTAKKEQTLDCTVKKMDSSLLPPPMFSTQHSTDRPASPVWECLKDTSLLRNAAEIQPFSTSKPEFKNNIPNLILQPVIEKQNVSLKEIDVRLSQFEEPKPDFPQAGSQPVRMFVTKSCLGDETQGPVTTAMIQMDNESSPAKDVKVQGNSKTDTLASVMVAADKPALMKISDSASIVTSATPQELATGARCKILTPKPKGEDTEVAALQTDINSPQREFPRITSSLSPDSHSPKSPFLSRSSPVLQPPSGEQTPPAEIHSPLLIRRKLAQTPDTPKQSQDHAQQTTDTVKTDARIPQKEKHNPFKAPQVIRKIRGEPFSDAAGHLKLWCQFFNVLSDSSIKWFRDEVEIASFKRSAGEETQVALAIVQASSIDCGVYGCSISNEYGTDTTDFLLSVDILSGMFLREDQEVGEEIEMTPLLFTKGMADSGTWGSKLFGRIMMEEANVGEGCSHKASRVKVIYGLEPVFESGTTCYIKVKSPIAYCGAKEQNNLVESNLAIIQQKCRIQSMAREYCKIFAAECRGIETFGPALEVIPVYVIYRPANTIPHATVESDLKGVYVRHCHMDASGQMVMKTCSEAALKCCALQHWIHQWTNGNLLLSRMEGVDVKITNVEISIKSKGYQSLTITENPGVFEQFVSLHQCNYYCGLLNLRLLKSPEHLHTPAKPKGSRSPLLHRKAGGSSSPQPSRKAAGSPRLTRKGTESGDSKPTAKLKVVDVPKFVLK